MCRNPLSRNFAGLSSVSICALILAFISVSPASWAQAPSPQVQGQMGQYPPGRPAPIGCYVPERAGEPGKCRRRSEGKSQS